MSSKSRFGDILEIAKHQGEELPYAEEGEGMPAKTRYGVDQTCTRNHRGSGDGPRSEEKQRRLYPDHGLYPNQYPQKCQDRVN